MAELSLWAEPTKLVDIRAFVEETGQDLGLDEMAIYALQLAVDEACTNIIMHAYGTQGGRIKVRIKSAGDWVEVIIRDWGEAFDPERIPSPDVEAPLEERRLGGMGLFLMQQMMDRVDFRFSATNGNTLTMAKRVPGREGQ